LPPNSCDVNLLFLISGPCKYNAVVELPPNSCDVLKVQHLMDKMVELFEVPYECQKIVHKG
jgi:hypothetical protein